MAIEAYRVLRKFGWRGWTFAPTSPCECDCRPQIGEPGKDGFQQARGGGVVCNGEVGNACVCKGTICRCSCRILPEQYGGFIWLVEDGHPRKLTMLGARFAISDPGLLPVDDLLKDEQYKRLLSPRQVRTVKIPAGAGRR